MSLGFSKLNLDLSQTKSLDQLVANVAEAVDEAEPGDWIAGRGWHQSKWTPKPKMVKGFQTNETLNEVFQTTRCIWSTQVAMPRLPTIRRLRLPVL